MVVQHVRRNAPPWAADPQHTFCNRKITPAVRLNTIQQLQEEMDRQRGAEPLPDMPKGVWVGDLVGTSAYAALCKAIQVCQLCMKLATYMRSWEQNPLLCMAQHAEFTAEFSDPHVRARGLADLKAVQQLIRENQDRFAEIAGREHALLSLNIGSSLR